MKVNWTAAGRVALINLLIIIIFWYIYHYMMSGDGRHFTVVEDSIATHGDALNSFYLSTSIHSAMGIRDVVPSSQSARALISAHQCIVALIFAGMVSALVN